MCEEQRKTSIPQVPLLSWVRLIKMIQASPASLENREQKLDIVEALGNPKFCSLYFFYKNIRKEENLTAQRRRN